MALPLRQHPFLVTGVGRSGTGYMAQLMRDNGYACGHEGYYSVRGRPSHPMLEGDSSWLSMPFLPVEVPTIHVVRHPLRVLESRLDSGFLSERGPPTSLWDDYAMQYVSGIEKGGDLEQRLRNVERFIHVWAGEIDRRTEGRLPTYRVEEADRWIEEAGLTLVGNADLTAELTPPDVNTRRHTNLTLTFEEAPLMAELADRWGYQA